MNLKNFTEEFLTFEHKFNLFSIDYADIKIWQYIRLDIYQKILEQKFTTTQNHDDLYKRRSENKFRLLSRIIFNSLKILLNPIFSADILVISTWRRLKKNKKFIEIYTDPILDNVNKRYISLEDNYASFHYNPAYTKNIVYLDFRIIIRIIIKNIFYHSYKLNPHLVSNIKHIENYFDINIDKKFLTNLIVNVLIEYKYLSIIYRLMLKIINPKLILEVNYNKIPTMIFNKNAKNLDIPIFELQHGFLGKYHISYNFKESPDLEVFPDYMLLWGDYWKKTTRFPIKPQKLLIAGFPYYKNRIQKIKNDSVKIGNKKNILFISEGHLGKMLAKIACELSEKINNRYKIIYKLHPGEYLRWKFEYPELNKSKIEVIDNNQHDIYYYLKQTDYLVGISSTTIIESLNFGIKIFIFPLYSFVYMEDIIKLKYAVLVKSVEDLCKKIQEDSTEIFKFDSQFFINTRPNFNIENLFSKIIAHEKKYTK